MLNRSDIRSDPTSGNVTAGIPLVLTMRVYNVGASCEPVAGALVDIWHCAADGLYSDVSANNTVGQKFLRGYQFTDDSGVATFTTIYPGWYQGRTVHIHFKIRTYDGTSKTYEFTSQLFFDDSLSDEVYANAPYNTRGSRSTLNSNDNIYDDMLLMNVAPSGDGYASTFDVGLQM
jgi:protocatechuate 3,4-dioxygenase beta subunit